MGRIGFGSATVAVGLLPGAGRPEPAGDERRTLVEEELARFQGTWQPVSAETDGGRAPQDRADKIRLVIKGSRHTLMFDEREVGHSVPFAIDPRTSPRSVVDKLEAGHGAHAAGLQEGEGRGRRWRRASSASPSCSMTLCEKAAFCQSL